MKCDEDGKILEFEVGDIFDDPWGSTWEICCTKAHLYGGSQQESWVIYRCEQDDRILIISVSELKKEFTEFLEWTEDDEPKRKHLYQIVP